MWLAKVLSNNGGHPVRRPPYRSARGVVLSPAGGGSGSSGGTAGSAAAAAASASVVPGEVRPPSILAKFCCGFRRYYLPLPVLGLLLVLVSTTVYPLLLLHDLPLAQDAAHGIDSVLHSHRYVSQTGVSPGKKKATTTTTTTTTTTRRTARREAGDVEQDVASGGGGGGGVGGGGDEEGDDDAVRQEVQEAGKKDDDDAESFLEEQDDDNDLQPEDATKAPDGEDDDDGEDNAGRKGGIFQDNVDEPVDDDVQQGDDDAEQKEEDDAQQEKDDDDAADIQEGDDAEQEHDNDAQQGEEDDEVDEDLDEEEPEDEVDEEEDEPEDEEEDEPEDETEATPPQKKSSSSSSSKTKFKPVGNPPLPLTLQDLQQLDPPIVRPTTLARGVSGLPGSQTPALVGAQRATLDCDDGVNVDYLAYWNNPTGDRDVAFVSPFSASASATEKYVSFEPDRGGWNNIRMSMEIILVFAVATGRTLVLPPDSPLYLLGADASKKHRGFGDFFPLHSEGMKKRLKIITMKEFMEREGLSEESPLAMDLSNVTLTQSIMAAAQVCVKTKKSENYCDPLNQHLRRVGHVPELSAVATNRNNCFVFDEQALAGQEIDLDVQERIDAFCGDRNQTFYDTQLHNAPLIHFMASERDYRLLSHFYAFFYFSNPVVDNYMKRFVRDFLHYHEVIYCAAGKIVRALQEEGRQRGFAADVDAEGAGGGYSALHIRRGDFQYKRVKISAQEWWENTRDLWKEGELLYIATDERDLSFFDDLAQHFDLRFLNQYWDLAGLGDLDPNYMGMVDTIVASRGRLFCGTWFSTFTGYITRMRGYHGMSTTTSFYGTLDRKRAIHEWAMPHGNFGAREWPTGWVGIDGDEYVMSGELEPVVVQEEEAANEEVTTTKTRRKTKAMTMAKDGVQESGTKKTKKKKTKKTKTTTTTTTTTKSSLARGVSGLPMEKTPALEGAQRGHVDCDVNVDDLAYWNDPQGDFDVAFTSPFATNPTGQTKYVSFQPDRGGWNNIRMCLEIIFVFALVTGRTLVLPPDQPLYLLQADSARRHRGFGDFFPLHAKAFQARVPVISTKEFLEREGGPDGRLPIAQERRATLEKIKEECVHMAKRDIYCGPLYEHLQSVGTVPELNANKCWVFDKDVFAGKKVPPEIMDTLVQNFCGKRSVVFFDSEMQDSTLVHFRTSEKEFRLLSHFYGFMLFTNPVVDNYTKRFVRDFLHYHNEIYCAAGKIVHAIQKEARQETLDGNAAAASYSSMHVRRGDLQYKKVKISAQEWWENSKELWHEGEVIFIATDERNRTFFDFIRQQGHELRFLDDYWDMAQLEKLDPNYLGMIDTIVASRGRIFVGTYFSTFSGYINRLRGYYGDTMKNSYYGFLDKKYSMHEWYHGDGNVFSREWAQGWIAIDGNEFADGTIF